MDRERLQKAQYDCSRYGFRAELIEHFPADAPVEYLVRVGVLFSDGFHTFGNAKSTNRDEAEILAVEAAVADFERHT